jgi:K+-sensing histidine kinase KdpD
MGRGGTSDGAMREGLRWLLARLGLALVAPAVVALLLVPLRSHVQSANLALVLVLAVLCVAVAGGRAAGIVAALSAALSYDFFLVVPYRSFTIARSDDIETTVLLALIGLIAGEIVERARRSEVAAIARRRDLDRIERRAELAAGGERPGRLIALSAEELTDLLDLDACTFVPTPPPENLPVFTHGAISVPSMIDDSAPRGSAALPVRAHGRDLGHFLLVFAGRSFGIGASVDAKHAATAVADQLGMALLRYRRP